MKLITTILATLAFASISIHAADEAKKTEKPKVDPEKAFAKKDTNSDGKLTKEEFLKGAKDAAKSETQFGAKDKDKSGDLSKEEYMAQGKKKKAA